MGTVKLGLNRKYKELIYLDLKEGGEEMRSLLQNLRKLLAEVEGILIDLKNILRV